MATDPETRRRVATQMHRIRDLVLERNSDVAIYFDQQPADDTLRFSVKTRSGVPIIDTSGHLGANELESKTDSEMIELLYALSGGRF